VVIVSLHRSPEMLPGLAIGDKTIASLLLQFVEDNENCFAHWLPLNVNECVPLRTPIGEPLDS
jgi:hypothetical protein